MAQSRPGQPRRGQNLVRRLVPCTCLFLSLPGSAGRPDLQIIAPADLIWLTGNAPDLQTSRTDAQPQTDSADAGCGIIPFGLEAGQLRSIETLMFHLRIFAADRLLVRRR